MMSSGPNLETLDLAQVPVGDGSEGDARDAVASQAVEGQHRHRVRARPRCPERDPPEVGVDLAKLDQDRCGLHRLSVGLDMDMRPARRKTPETYPEGGSGIVDRPEPILAVGIAIGLDDDLGVQAEACGEDRVVGGLVRAPGQPHSRHAENRRPR